MKTEIEQFRAGDTLQWRKSEPDYPASDGWSAHYRLSGAQQIDVDAVASGDDFDFTIKPVDSDDYIAGEYSYAGWVEKGSGASLERYTLWVGTVTITPNLAALTGTTDNRSFARIELEKIETAIKNYSTNPVTEIEIAGRRFVRPELSDLLKLRSQIRAEIEQEADAVRIEQGLGGKKVLVRMGATS